MRNSIVGFMLIFVITFLSSGCATWNGIKKDSSDGWEATKRTFNEARE